GLILSIIFRLRKPQKLLSYFFYLIPAFIVLLNKFSNISYRYSNENLWSVGNRTQLWKYFIYEYLYPINLNTITGYGLKFSELMVFSPDNFYIEIILRYGIVGISLFMYMIIYFLKHFLKYSNYSIFIMIAVVLISDLTGAINMNPDITIFYFLMLGFFYNKIKENSTIVNDSKNLC
ncbi:MAG: hypothetical protein WBP82_08915, partial [Leuconostoc mesenteroides]